MRRLLLPASALYGAGAALHRAWRRRLPRWDRALPVVLVGNLTVGGTGKTPLAALLATLLRRAGRRPAIVLRGYRRAGGPDPAVAGDGRRTLLPARAAGDEAWMLARALPGVGVVVGRDRVAACRLAADRLRADVLVLDDGFQQRDRFPGALRVVAVNAADPFGNGALLPAGTLRERPAALREADLVVLTHARDAGRAALARLDRRVRALAPGAALARADHAIAGLAPAAGGAGRPSGWLRGRPVGALAAIGHPEGFARSLAAAGARVALRRFARDHHRWTAGEVRDAFAAARRAGCAAVVTTAKDAARLPAAPRGGPPLLVARLALAFAPGGLARVRRALRGLLARG